MREIAQHPPKPEAKRPDSGYRPVGELAEKPLDWLIFFHALQNVMLPLPNWITLERQREGIAKAKAEGKYKGRKPSARAKADQVRELGKPEWEPRKLASS